MVKGGSPKVSSCQAQKAPRVPEPHKHGLFFQAEPTLAWMGVPDMAQGGRKDLTRPRA